MVHVARRETAVAARSQIQYGESRVSLRVLACFHMFAPRPAVKVDRFRAILDAFSAQSAWHLAASCFINEAGT